MRFKPPYLRELLVWLTLKLKKDLINFHNMVKTVRQFIFLLFIGLLPILANAEESKIGGDFELTSQLDERYSSVEARGKVILLFFGFTHCPDVCPNTLSAVQTVLGQLNEDAKYVQPIFISVDPQRDTPEILQNYLKYFGNNFIGLTGTSKEIDEVVKQFQGFYSYEGNVKKGHYSVDHTSNLYVISTKGEVTNIIPYGLPPNVIKEAVQKQLVEIKT